MQRDDALLRAWSEPGGTAEPPDVPRRRHRSTWISDLHPGTPAGQAHALLDFLLHVESGHLFRVGALIDGWQLRRSWYWPQAHNDVVQQLTSKRHKT